MSYYVNQALLALVSIDGVNVTDRVLSWTVSDTTLKNVGCMSTSGELVLGQADELSEVLDYGRDSYRRGTEVIVDVKKKDGSIVRHPRGLLYVISSSYSPQDSTQKIEIGCRLTLSSLTDDVEAIRQLVPVPLDPAQNDFQSVSASFASGGSYIYQDNQGNFQTGEFFEGDQFGEVSPGSWVSIYGKTALSVSPLQQGGAIPDTIQLSYSYPFSGLTEDNKGKIVQDEAVSNYFLQYPGTVYIRSQVLDGIPGGSSPEQNNAGVGSSCGNSPSSPGESPNRPNSCSDGYTTEGATITQPAKKVQASETIYDGPGGQVSYSLQETRGPAIEVNGQYYSDAYAACRYSYATACNPGGSCPLEGMEVILQGYTEDFYTYDTFGALSKKTTDTYKNILGAAQPFNWRAGNVNGSAQGFIPLSTISYYLSRRVISEYEEEENFRKETTTTYTSVAEQGSGIGNVASEVLGATTSLTNPSQFPRIKGSFSNLETATTGGGSGLKINANFGGGGTVTSVGGALNLVPQNTSILAIRNGVPMYGGSGTGLLVSFRYEGFQNTGFIYFNIIRGGEGYKVGDVLSLAQPGTNPYFNFQVRVNAVTDPLIATTVVQAGSGYFDGDTIWVTPDTIAQAAAASGQSVNLSGAPNLTYRVKKVSNTDGGGTPQTNAATLFSITGTPPSMIAGAYRKLAVEQVDSDGVGAIVDVFVTTGGGARSLNMREQIDLGSLTYYQTLKRYGFYPQGGSGSGLKVSLRFNALRPGDRPYNTINDIIRDGFNLLAIESGGGGYRSGDIVTLDFNTVFKAFGFRYYTGNADQTRMVWQIGSTVPTSAEAFTTIGGAGYKVGDIVQVSGGDLAVAGAAKTDPGPLRLKVEQVSQGLAATTFSINAMNGVITRNINRSTTITTLPIAPDVVNSPVTETKDGESIIVLRQGQAKTTPPEADTLVAKLSIPVPLLFESEIEIEDAVRTYERYTKSFILGDALGLQVTEGLREEIIDNWKPGLSFRFYDPRCNKLMAMRMDAVTWGITPTESAIAINGIYLGESNGTVSIPSNTIGDETVGVLPPSGGGLSGGSIRPSGEPRPVPTPPVVENETGVNQGDYLLWAKAYSSLRVDVTFRLIIGGNSQAGNVAQNVNPYSQTVVYLTGAIVEPGTLLTADRDGGIPYSFGGTLLTNSSVVLLDPFEQ